MKKTKLMVSAALASSLITSSVFAATLSFPVPKDVIKAGDINYYPLRTTLESAGLKIEYDKNTNSVIVSDKEMLGKFSMASGLITHKNGNTESGKNEYRIEQGKIYASLMFMSNLLDKKFILKDGVVSEMVDTQTPVYTLDKLIEMGMEKNKALFKAQLELDRTEEIKEYKSVYLSSWNAGTGSSAAEAENLSKIMQSKSNKVAVDLAIVDVETQKDAVVYSVTSAVESIYSTKKSIENTKKSLEYKTKENIVNHKKAEQGLLSDLDIKKSDLELKSLKEMLSAQEKDLAIAYDKLSKLVDMPKDKVYNVDVTSVEYKPLGEINLDGEVVQRVEKSPTLYKLKKAIELKKMGVDFYVYNHTGDSYRTKELDLAKATVDLGNAEQETRAGVTEIYKKIKQLELAREALQIDLLKAKEDLNLASINYKAGMITLLDVEKAELGVAAAQMKIETNTMQHLALKRAFYKPWISTSTSS